MIGLLGQLALRRDQRILAGHIQQSGRHLPEHGAHGVAILAHHENLCRSVVLGGVLALAQGHYGHCVVMGHGLPAHRLVPLGQHDLLIVNGEDRTAPDPLARANRSTVVTGVL